MVNILALDTSGDQCAVAVLAGGEIRAQQSTVAGRAHAERLMPMILTVMSAAGRNFAELDGVAATIGPGSFTGLRVGLAAARGIALAAGIATLGIGTLEALARALGVRSGHHLAMVAKGREVHPFQLFDPLGVALGAPRAGALEDLAAVLPAGPCRLAGSGAEALLRVAGRADLVAEDAPDDPPIEIVARLAGDRFAGGIGTAPLVPLYLQPVRARKHGHDA